MMVNNVHEGDGSRVGGGEEEAPVAPACGYAQVRVSTCAPTRRGVGKGTRACVRIHTRTCNKEICLSNVHAHARTPLAWLRESAGTQARKRRRIDSHNAPSAPALCAGAARVRGYLRRGTDGGGFCGTCVGWRHNLTYGVRTRGGLREDVRVGIPGNQVLTPTRWGVAVAPPHIARECAAPPGDLTVWEKVCFRARMRTHARRWPGCAKARARRRANAGASIPTTHRLRRLCAREQPVCVGTCAAAQTAAGFVARVWGGGTT